MMIQYSVGANFVICNKLATEQQPPTFWPMSIVAKWLDGSRCHLVWMEVHLGPGHIVLDGNPAPP